MLKDNKTFITTELNDLTDVTVPAPNDGDALIYDATSTTWVNTLCL